MEGVKKIGARILLLGAIILLSNFIYVHTTYEHDLDENGNVLQKLETGIEKSDILYFSSSPNATYSDLQDSDYRSISQMVDDALPNHSITSVDTGAIHAGVYKALIALIPQKSKVETVVVHLNYRSFGQGWIQSDLENAIQKQMVFYNSYPPIVNRFLQGLNCYDAVPQIERERIMLARWRSDQLPFDPPRNTVESWCAVEKWGDWTNPKRQLADHYIKNFAFTIQEGNPRLQDYDAIVKICEEKDINLIYVILPENLQEAEKLVDADLTELMYENKELLKDRYEEMGVTVIDNFALLPDSAFLERNFPSEHYFDFGRKKIAESIINVLQQDAGN